MSDENLAIRSLASNFGFQRYFCSSKPNSKSLKKNLRKLPSSLSIPYGMLATNHPGGLQTNLTSSYNCYAFAFLLFAVFFFACFLSFCLALHHIMVTIADDHGTWPGLMCTIFLLAWYLMCLHHALYFANKDWLNNNCVMKETSLKMAPMLYQIWFLKPNFCQTAQNVV